MSDTFTIRRARPDDYDTVRSVALETLPDLNADETASAFTSNVDHWVEAKRAIHVAEIDGRVVGHASLGPYQDGDGPVFHSDAMILHQIAVLGAYQGTGIGDALLNETLATARWFGAGLIFAAVNDSSAPFYAKKSWLVGQPNDGFTFIEQEKTEDAGGSTPDDVLRFLTHASKPRGLKVGLSGGFNRIAYKVLNPKAIRTVFWTPATEHNPNCLPLPGTVDRVCSDHSFVAELPLSVLLMISAHLVRRVGKEETRTIIRKWLRESGESKSVPSRLGTPSLTPMQVFDELLSNS